MFKYFLTHFFNILFVELQNCVGFIFYLMNFTYNFIDFFLTYSSTLDSGLESATVTSLTK